MRWYLSCIALALVAIPLADAFPPGRVVKRNAGSLYKDNSFLVHFHEDSTDEHIAQLRAMPGVTVNHRFDSTVFHGVSVSTDGSINPRNIAATFGVKTVYPNGLTRLDFKRNHVQGAADILHEKTGLFKTVDELGLDGTGVKIGIVDTGVEYTHPDLGGCWKTKGCKWQFGTDLVGDDYNSLVDGSVPQPDNDPMDCVGHGTHVAGIIGATGKQVRGVAPGATLGMYRIFGCGMVTEAGDDMYIKGMEAAAKDGVDIINISAIKHLFADEPIAVAAANLVAKGVIVVASTGNNGDNGLLTVGTPATGSGVISVGAVDNWKIKAPGVIFTSPAGSHVSYKGIALDSDMQDAKPPFIFKKGVPLVAAVGSAGNTDGCSPFNTSLKGKIAFVDRGNCPDIEKGVQAQRAGAVGVVIAGVKPGPGRVAVDDTKTIPVIVIPSGDAQVVRQLLKQGNVVVKSPRESPEKYRSFDIATGGQMSHFSSYGPSAELNLEPVISAPGGFIWSTMPRANNSYGTFSGTSQAAPYVAGAAALLKQARPELTASDIYNILVSTAQPIPSKNTNLAATPYQSGGGLVNIYDAIRSRALIDPPVISINDTAYETPIASGKRGAVRTLTVRNTDLEKTLYASVSNTLAESVTMWNANGSLVESVYNGAPLPTWPVKDSTLTNDTVPQLDASSLLLKVAPGKTASLTVTITAPSGLDESGRWFYGGFVNFALQWEGEETTSSQVVPYGGFNGEFSKLRVIPDGTYGVPGFADVEGNTVSAADVDIRAESEFYFGLSLDMPTRQVEVGLMDANGKFVGYLENGVATNVPRTFVAVGPPLYFSLNGRVHTSHDAEELIDVLPGKYYIFVKALRTFGNPAKATDFETWTSDLFTITEPQQILP
ncbi:hypothetical protein GGF46_002325 [Coemansia sp. RSA 552]|nr:hypothetical protein GGF46_002325 [Coemansia sp. RSA 552]